jgi:hypothetical protein
MICGCTHEKELHSHGTDFCKVEGCDCDIFISDIQKWKEEKARRDWEDAQDARIWDEVYAQEDVERADNDDSSGSTDLGNPGGTTFCW